MRVQEIPGTTRPDHGGNMSSKSKLSIVLPVLMFCTSAMFAQPPQTDGAATRMSKSSASSMIASWPEKPRDMATKLMTKYGPPDEATSSMLVWHNNGPWKRTILYKEEIPHEFPAPHTDFLQQVVDYRVPPEKFGDLARYDGSVIVERTKGEISARCDMEELNMLALNLANDVATGKHKVAEARDNYAKMAMAFKQGKQQPYTQSLQFQPGQGNTADPDKPANPTMASAKP
jgi:hypothetical protein